MQPEIHYRKITEIKEIEAVVVLQETVWGRNNVTPLAQLVATSHNGGVIIGAFEAEKLVGFCYGFPGFEKGEVYLCSHMLGILPEYRDCGIGKRLKLEQRKWALEYGFHKMTWTFDPLEARNAYLNLCKLGGFVKTYIPSYYGDLDDKINIGLPSDRFVLEWMLDSERAEYAVREGVISHQIWQEYHKRLQWENAGAHPSPLLRDEEVDQTGYLLPVPRSIHELKREDIELAQKWRYALREQFLHLFSQGYVVVGMIRSDEPVHYYVLEKSDAQ